MKKKYSSIRNYTLLIASLIGGFLAADTFKRGLERQDIDTVSAFANSNDAPAQFVQEPASRSSFRPSLSNSIKNSNKRTNQLVLRAFADAVGRSYESTVQIRTDGKQIALGAIVGTDGWVLTKSSQIPPSKDIICRLFDYREYLAEVVTSMPELDLTLLRIPQTNLPTVVWDEGLPNRGNWVATTDLKSTPRAVGVVSTGVQRIRRAKAVLGVHLVDSSEGAAVTRVLPGTGASEAGLKIGDNIYEVNGKEVFTLGGFRKAIVSVKGGEFVRLGVDRAETRIEIDARLMDLTDELLDETEMEVNGRISARATGFSQVFLHDTVLEPNQCGGPLVNLDGRIVGINIARAGRVTSYALPVQIVKPAVESLIEEARLVSRRDDTNQSTSPVR